MSLRALSALRSLRLAALAALAGCSSSIPQQELPQVPIAISYRTQEEARRRADEFSDQRERAEAARRPVDAARAPRGGYADLVASEENVTEFFDRVFGRGKHRPAAQNGHKERKQSEHDHGRQLLKTRMTPFAAKRKSGSPPPPMMVLAAAVPI